VGVGARAGSGAVEIEERSFVAKGAPLDDGQGRVVRDALISGGAAR